MAHPLRTVFLLFVLAIAAGFAAVQSSTGAIATGAPGQSLRPNFIFILGEGHGWSTTSVQMDDRIPDSKRTDGLTPNLEKLAASGMRFTDFYATCPRCTPSRASFFTGISPAKLHMTFVNEGGAQRDGKGGGGGGGVEGGGGQGGGGNRPVDPDRPARLRLIAPQPEMELPSEVQTTAEVLKSAGYATAHFGKWHVGRVSPSKHGFDENDGPNNNGGPGNKGAPNPAECAAITDKGLAFMDANTKAGKPFFVQMSHYACTSEAEVTPESLAEVQKLLPDLRGKALTGAGALRDMDKAIGRIMRRTAELGIADNTYIIFSTDHGTPGGGGGGGGGRGSEANAPLSRGKGSVQEGGTRIPFIVRGPGVAPGTFCHSRATGMDLLPTLADLAGKPIVVDEKRKDEKSAIEGGSLAALLKASGQGTVKRSRAEIVIHFPHYDLSNGGPASALYLDKYKLLRVDETGKRLLFDMSRDWAERNDLSAAMPEKVKELEAKLDAYLDAVDAQRATVNPAYVK